jgi:hypothetical protein
MVTPLKEDQLMQAFSSTFTTLTVTAIYYVWRAYSEIRLRQEITLRQRVSYMLWVMAAQIT